MQAARPAGEHVGRDGGRVPRSLKGRILNSLPIGPRDRRHVEIVKYLQVKGSLQKKKGK